MGMCLPCLGGATEDVVQTPDPETRRKQLAYAAEKRLSDTNVHRGIKNPEAVERKKRKQEEMEKQQMNTSSSGGGGLRWQVG
ncbi:small VCP/p97-interacting protein [Leucoraja erinacea]|uniref:small VCP/p97-interacting protein n=1 Tax=Leucoraja erinaceus TaxID=7782 RepID=UPI0024565629|nr:small VCP/p97-interacting protein [Leucoraja erinacea]